MSNLAKIPLKELLESAKRTFKNPSQGERAPQGILIVGGDAPDLVRAIRGIDYFITNPVHIELSREPERYRKGWYSIEVDKIEVIY